MHKLSYNQNVNCIENSHTILNFTALLNYRNLRHQQWCRKIRQWILIKWNCNFTLLYYIPCTAGTYVIRVILALKIVHHGTFPALWQMNYREWKVMVYRILLCYYLMQKLSVSKYFFPKHKPHTSFLSQPYKI